MRPAGAARVGAELARRVHRVRRMLWWKGALLAAALLALASAGRSEELVDEDGDGVQDEVDYCIDTPAGDFVDDLGCSVCDCETSPEGDAWSSRRAYVRCVVTEARARLAAGRITAEEWRFAIKRARASSCGNEDLTRCCLFRKASRPARCRVMPWERCDADRLHVLDAVDWDVGSCLPNPCTREE